MPTAKKSTKKATKKAGKKTTKKATKKATKKKTAKKASSRKQASAKKASKKAPAKKATKRAPNPAFMKPLTPSADLGAVIGARPMPRTEVTKRVWDYIKKNNLQDKNNRRMINADEKLLVVFKGRKQVNMFEMTKLIAAHLK
jgi:upstream activation factor subunit UAF30